MLWFGPNELLLLVDRVVTFSIRASHQTEVCGESRLSQGLKDNVTGYVRSLNDEASETSLTSPDDFGLCVCLD